MRKNAFAKWLFVISGALSVVLTAFFVNQVYYPKYIDGTWKETKVVLSNSDGFQIISQTHTGDERRYIKVENDFLGFKRFKIIDKYNIPDADWVVKDPVLFKELKIVTTIKNESELKKKFTRKFNGVLMLEKDLSFDEDPLFKGIKNATLKRSPQCKKQIKLTAQKQFVFSSCENIELGKLSFQSALKFRNCKSVLIDRCDFGKLQGNRNELRNEYIKDLTNPEKIVFINCEQVVLNGSYFLPELEFRNCKSVVIKDSDFNGSVDNAIYINDACSDIEITKCTFSEANQISINAPYGKIKVSGCFYDVGFDNIEFRGYKFEYTLSEFYETGICNNKDYLFSNDEEAINLTDDCKIGKVGTPTGLGFHLSRLLNNTLGNDFPELSFSYKNGSLWRYVTDGIVPWLDRPSSIPRFENGDIPKFEYVNPAFIEWWMENMVPEPETKIGNLTAASLYKQLYSFDIRLSYETFLYINNHKVPIDEQVKDYLALIWGYDNGYEDEEPEGDAEYSEDNEMWGIQRLLNEVYIVDLYSIEYTEEDSNFTNKEMKLKEDNAGEMVAFWIRRNMDGSDKALANLLKKILTDYDPEYLEYIEERYISN